MRISIILTCALIAYFVQNTCTAEPRRYFTHPNGALRTEKMALVIGERYLLDTFGKDVIKMQRPLNARLIENVWIVSGTMPNSAKYGGVATIKLRKVDGAVLGFVHTK